MLAVTYAQRQCRSRITDMRTQSTVIHDNIRTSQNSDPCFPTWIPTPCHLGAMV